MASPQYMQMPPAGTYPYQQQQPQPAYYPQPQNYYPPQQVYGQQQQNFSPPPPQYLQSYPQQFQQQAPYAGPPSQAWPSHAGEYMGPGVKYGNYHDDDGPDYNNPPEPQYGVPESKRGSHDHGRSHSRSNSQSRDGNDPRFVFPNNNGQQQSGPNGEGERGLGATVLGGGAGAFLGHKMGHGALGTVGGLAIGAIAANAFEHHEKKKKEERRESRAFDEGYEDGEDRRSHHSRSRDIDDDSYGDRYDDREYSRYGDRDLDYEEEEPRHHHHYYRDSRDYDDRYYEQDRYYEDDSYDRREDW